MRRVIALAIDQEQLRRDARLLGYYVGGLLLFVLMFGLIAEIWQVIDFLPLWVDAMIVAIYLILAGILAYDRYTVEENAGTSEEDSV